MIWNSALALNRLLSASGKVQAGRCPNYARFVPRLKLASNPLEVQLSGLSLTALPGSMTVPVWDTRGGGAGGGFFTEAPVMVENGDGRNTVRVLNKTE